jgi:pyruvate formate lyase activating enzyme
MYDSKKCVACGRCAAVCPRNCHSFDEKHTFGRELCIGCGACAEVCPAKALEIYGKCVTADEIYDEVKRDKVFYETSGGGVTISGGEPLFQPEFTAELLRKCRENGIHTAIETSGFADEKALLAVIEHCDLVLFDIKETDRKRHKQYIGVSLTPILENLKLINKNKIPLIIRAPIIPTLNDREPHFNALKAIRESMEFCRGVQIMPYHRVGSYKYELLDKKYICNDIFEPTKEMIEEWGNLI